MQKKHFYVGGYLLLSTFLHVNAILKAEDPIADTQTEAILYDQKMEQEKDGVKAPATPKMIYYGGQGFLTKSSLSKHEKEIVAAARGKKKDKFSWSDWWEDDHLAASSSDSKLAAQSAQSSETQSGEIGAEIADVLPELPQNLDGTLQNDSGLLPVPAEPKNKKVEAEMLLEDVAEPESLESGLPQPSAEGEKKNGDDWW